jgi:hypothetical protein
MQPVIGVAAHRAKLQHREDMPTLADTLRAKEDRAGRRQLDQRPNHKEEWGQRNQRERAGGHIKRALGW